jgi:hypothetical protein
MFVVTPRQSPAQLLAHALSIACLLATLGLAHSADAQTRKLVIPSAVAQDLLGQSEAMVAAGNQAGALKRMEEVTGPEHQVRIRDRSLERRLRLLLATTLARKNGKRGAVEAMKLLSADLERVAVDRALRICLAELLSSIGDDTTMAAALRLLQSTAGQKTVDESGDQEELLTLARLRKQQGDQRGVEEALSACRKRAAVATTCREERLLIEATALTPKEYRDLLAVLRRLQSVQAAKPGSMHFPTSKKTTGCKTICEDPENPLCVGL